MKRIVSRATVYLPVTGRELRCRAFEERDLEGILKLWESQSGWGSLTAATWRSWYRGTPHGDAIIMVTVNREGEIVGQMVFTPSRVRIAGDVVSALRMSAPILHESIRNSRLDNSNPVYEMFSAGFEAGLRSGVKVVYSFPNHRWLPVWKRWKANGFIIGRTFEREHECFQLPFTSGLAVQDGVTVTQVGLPGEEHAELWRAASDNLSVSCAVDRSIEWLRYNRGNGISLEARRGSKLVGYAVVNTACLLTEFFAVSESEILPVLRAIVAMVAQYPFQGGLAPEGLKLMQTPQLASAARTLGATRVDFDFAFIGSAIAPELSSVVSDPENWYLTPGD